MNICPSCEKEVQGTYRYCSLECKYYEGVRPEILAAREAIIEQQKAAIAELVETLELVKDDYERTGGIRVKDVDESTAKHKESSDEM